MSELDTFSELPPRLEPVFCPEQFKFEPATVQESARFFRKTQALRWATRLEFDICEEGISFNLPEIPGAQVRICEDQLEVVYLKESTALTSARIRFWEEQVARVTVFREGTPLAFDRQATEQTLRTCDYFLRFVLGDAWMNIDA